MVLNKEDKLKEIINNCGSAVIAFSGGVDSSYLALIASQVLNDNALAVTLLSSSYPSRQKQEAEDIVRKIGLQHIFIQFDELDIPEFRMNGFDRCYHCKQAMLMVLKEIAEKEHFSEVFEGSNRDDIVDYRPGRKAVAELGVRSPLLEAGMSKNDIRSFSRTQGLETWNKPAFACLASRFPYGMEISKGKLEQVEKGEQFLLENGFSQFRARHHGDTVRIELHSDDLIKAVSEPMRTAILEKFREIGFRYVSVDIEGYRTGSMNEVLETEGGENGFD